MVYVEEKSNISLKEINKKNILKMIIEIGPISRIDISKQLRISRPTTSVYIGELIKDNLIKEVGKGNSTRYGGKKAVLLQFNRRAGYILGVMIGVKTIRTALTDLESKIVEKIKIPTEEWLGPKAVIDKIVKSLKEIIKISGVNKEKIIGVGIGATGLVDSRKGMVIFSPNLDGWNNIKLKEDVEKRIGLPTFIENECRIQAIAEKKYGLAKNVNSFVCVETGIGIGTGVFMDNKLVVGNRGMAGEVGHIMTDLAGSKECHCGNRGCLETLCSVNSLLEDVEVDIRKSRKSSEYNNGKIKIEDLYRLYERGDDITTRNVEKNAEYLGIGISNAIKMFNPELIIIHGEVIKFGEKYLEKVKESVSENTFPKVKDDYYIHFSKLGETVGIIGAASIVFDNVFNLENLDIAEQYIIKKRLY